MGILTTASNACASMILWGKAHSAALYTAVGVSSGLGSVISGIAVTPGVTRKLDKAKEERPDMTFWEAFKLVAPSYIPCLLLFGTSATCFILNTLKEERKIATLAGLYSISEKNFSEYRDKVKEMFGERKEAKVKDEVALDKARAAWSNSRPVIITGDGTYPCLDAWSNTKFRSSQLAMREAMLNIRERLSNEMYLSLTEVYEEMHLPVRLDENGYPLIDRSDIGWTKDDDLEFIYTYGSEANGEPMMVITFSVPPHPNYYKVW